MRTEPLRYSELLPATQTYLKAIHADINLSRERRRDAGFETGFVTRVDGSKWYRNVDPLPPFKEWFERDGSIYDEN